MAWRPPLLLASAAMADWLTHWINAVALVVMAGSGLQILVAFRSSGRGVSPTRGTPSRSPPLALGPWDRGWRVTYWHFAFAWVLVANAFAYLGYLVKTGEWRRRAFYLAETAATP